MLLILLLVCYSNTDTHTDTDTAVVVIDNSNKWSANMTTHVNKFRPWNMMFCQKSENNREFKIKKTNQK